MSDDKLAGLPVGGYKPQPKANVVLVNGFKIDEELLARKIDAAPAHCDPRLLALARTYFQIGFMLLNRAVFQPGRLSDEEIGKLQADIAAAQTPDKTGPAGAAVQGE